MERSKAYNLFTGEIVEYTQRKFSVGLFFPFPIKHHRNPDRPLVVTLDLFNTLFRKL